MQSFVRRWRADGHLSAVMKDRDAERAREVLERKAAGGDSDEQAEDEAVRQVQSARRHFEAQAHVEELRSSRAATPRGAPVEAPVSTEDTKDDASTKSEAPDQQEREEQDEKPKKDLITATADGDRLGERALIGIAADDARRRASHPLGLITR